MLRPMLTATALALVLSAPALAQQETQPEAAPTETPEMEGAGQAPDMESTDQAPAAGPDGQGQAAEEPEAPAETEQAAEGAPDDEMAGVEGDFIVEQTEKQVLATQLMDATVIDAQGNDIGDITDFLVDPEGGIHGVVVGVGGFLGIGAKDVAVPWSSVQHSPEEMVVNLDLTREDLEGAPDFMTLADIRAEEEAAAAQQQQMMQQPQGAAPTTPSQ